MLRVRSRAWGPPSAISSGSVSGARTSAGGGKQAANSTGSNQPKPDDESGDTYLVGSDGDLSESDGDDTCVRLSVPIKSDLKQSSARIPKSDMIVFVHCLLTLSEAKHVFHYDINLGPNLLRTMLRGV